MASNLGKDITLPIYQFGYIAEMQCLRDLYGVGFVDTETPACFLSDVVLYLSLVVIVGIVSVRFLLAVYFHVVYGHRSGLRKGEKIENIKPIVSIRSLNAYDIEQFGIYFPNI